VGKVCVPVMKFLENVQGSRRECKMNATVTNFPIFFAV